MALRGGKHSSRPTSGSSEATVISLLRAANWPTNTMADAAATVVAESSAVADATSANPDGNQNIGLFQIDTATARGAGFDPSRLKEPLYNIQVAKSLSRGGTNWSIWSTHTPSDPRYYKKFLGQNPKVTTHGSGGVLHTIENIGEDIIGAAFPGLGLAQGWFPGGSHKNPVSVFTDPIKAIGTFMSLLLNPAKAGEYFASLFSLILKNSFKAIYRYVFLPPWHWTERAADYYAVNELNVTGKTDQNPLLSNKALMTVGFWSFGFVLLWGQVEEQSMRDEQGRFVKQTKFGVGAKPNQSALGKTISGTIMAAKKTRLKKDPEKETKVKPKPQVSKVEVKVNRYMSATRRRAVTVTESSPYGSRPSYRTGGSAPRGNVSTDAGESANVIDARNRIEERRRSKNIRKNYGSQSATKNY